MARYKLSGPDGYTAYVDGEAVTVRQGVTIVASGRVVQSVDDYGLVPVEDAPARLDVKPALPRYVREALEDLLARAEVV